jgi:hypothetical protein
MEQCKSYLISLGLIIALMLLLMTPIAASNRFNELFQILHIVALFVCVLLGGSLFTSTAFSAYSTPARGIPAIMLPASRLEKFLFILLANMVFMILIIVVFWQLHHGLVDIANQHLPDTSREYRYIPQDATTFLTYCFFLIQGVVLLGSIYFSKNGYIKTAGIFLVLGLIAYLINIFLAYQLTDNPPYVFAFPFTSWRVSLDRTYMVEFPEGVQALVRAFLVMLVVSLWYIAYVRLKEKEI